MKKSEYVQGEEAVQLHAKVIAARELCGCHACQGGYPIGKATLGFHMDTEVARPHSCLASALLDHLLMGTEVTSDEKEEADTSSEG